MESKELNPIAGTGTSSSTAKGIGSTKIDLVFNFGNVLAVSELKPQSIALDGAVHGVYIDTTNQIYSFDHTHAPTEASVLADTVNPNLPDDGNSVSAYTFATRSTCAQVWAAIRMGLNPTGFRVFVNDVDADTTLAVYMLAFPEMTTNQVIIEAVNSVDLADAIPHGTAIFGRGSLYSALSHGYANRDLGQIIDDLETIGKFANGTAGNPSAYTADSTITSTGTAVIVNSAGSIDQIDNVTGGIDQLINGGAQAFCLYRELDGGNYKAVVGVKSVFVNVFDMSVFYNEANKVDPAMEAGGLWGGTNVMGGSPRNGGTGLTPFQLKAIFTKAYTGSDVDNQ